MVTSYLHQLGEIYLLSIYSIPITYAGLAFPELVLLAIYIMFWFCFINNIFHQIDKSFSLTCFHNKYPTS